MSKTKVTQQNYQRNNDNYKKMDYGTVYYNMQIKFLMFNENKFRKQESNYDL